MGKDSKSSSKSSSRRKSANDRSQLSQKSGRPSMRSRSSASRSGTRSESRAAPPSMPGSGHSQVDMSISERSERDSTDVSDDLSRRQRLALPNGHHHHHPTAALPSPLLTVGEENATARLSEEATVQIKSGSAQDHLGDASATVSKASSRRPSDRDTEAGDSDDEDNHNLSQEAEYEALAQQDEGLHALDRRASPGPLRRAHSTLQDVLLRSTQDVFKTKAERERLLDEQRFILEEDNNMPLNSSIRQLKVSKSLSGITYLSSERLAPVKMTLGFISVAAYALMFPGRRLVIEHSYGTGWYCRDANSVRVSIPEARAVAGRIRGLLLSHQVHVRRWPLAKVIRKAVRMGDRSKLGLLKVWRPSSVPVVTCGSAWDLRLSEYETNAAILTKCFDIIPYDEGFILNFPCLHHINSAVPMDKVHCSPFKDQPLLWKTVKESERLGRDLNLATVADMNDAVFSKQIENVVWVAEANYENEISAVADAVEQSLPQKRIVCIAGPSSSGKTTSSDRLRVQLRVRGIRAMVMGMDNYYRDDASGLIPKLPNGMFDYEDVQAIDLPLFSQRVNMLLDGKPIPERKFDFREHAGKDLPESEAPFLSLHSSRSVIVIEGIHGLNPALTKSLGGPSKVIRVCVSAMCHLNIHDSLHFSTADNRLLRRMLRDYRTRGYDAAATLERWLSVRHGEERFIFPYTEHADFFINTALAYEMSVLAPLCRPLLAEVSLRASPYVRKKADYLLKVCSFFYSFYAGDLIPLNSVLREFIGGSYFNAV